MAELKLDIVANLKKLQEDLKKVLKEKLDLDVGGVGKAPKEGKKQNNLLISLLS